MGTNFTFRGRRRTHRLPWGEQHRGSLFLGREVLGPAGEGGFHLEEGGLGGLLGNWSSNTERGERGEKSFCGGGKIQNPY